MKRFQIVAVVAVIVLAAGCAPKTVASDEPLFSGPSPASLRGMGAAEALALANQWKGNKVTSYVTPQSVNFEFPNGQKASVGLPAEEMVVAIAPYFEQTHPCETHYMSGCQGELVGVPIDVEARALDGTVLIDGTMLTMPNGFIELWLPRDQEISVRVSADERSATGAITTYADSNTCITTLQMM